MIQRMHLKKLLLLSTASTLVLALLSCFVVGYELNKNSKLKDAANHAGEYSRSLELAKFYISQVQQFLTDASLTREEDSLQEAKQNYDELVKTLEVAKALTPSEAKELDEIEKIASETYRTGLEMTHAYWDKGKDAGDLIMKRPETGLDDRSTALTKALSTEAATATALKDRLNDELNESIRTVSFVVALTMIIFFIVVTSILWVIWRRIQPIVQITAIVGKASNDVQTSANQVSTGAKNMMAIVVQQAASVQQTSAAAEQISSMAYKSAEHAHSVKNSAEESMTIAKKGNEQFQELISSMQNMKQTNDMSALDLNEANAKVSATVKIIEEMTAKIGVINDIVFQTKLLSFNASVEAARAGEHGKGFAVVAEEVGNLAAMSGKAAKEINQLLEESLQQVRSSVAENERSVKKMLQTSSQMVDSGIKMTEDCNQSLNSIYSSAAKVQTMVQEITAGTEEISKGISEITKAISQIDQTSQTVSRVAESCEVSAEKIGNEAVGLQAIASDLSLAVRGKKWINSFEWSEEYRLHVDGMDDEHRTLMTKINTLAHYMDAGDKKAIPQAFQDLADFTVQHFNNEESYLATIRYPGLVAHKKIHKNLLAKLSHFGQQLSRNSLDNQKFISFLNDWLIKHILGVDMKYAHFAKGEKNSAVISLQDDSDDYESRAA